MRTRHGHRADHLLEALLAVPAGAGHLTRLCDLTHRMLRAQTRP
jgi:hypothetical protein